MNIKTRTVTFSAPRWLRNLTFYAALPIGAMLGTATAVRAGVVVTTFTAGSPIKAADVNANFKALSDAVTALQGQTIPPGTVSAFGGTTAPAGWLLCDGSSIARAANPQLFAAIGTAWGSADTSHFNLPDLRGRFLRGTDSGSARDPDRATRTVSAPGGAVGDGIGTLEVDAFKTHDHGGKTGYANFTGGGWSTNVDWSGTGTVGNGVQFAPETGAADPLSNHTHSITAQGGSETRPINASVNWIIKAD